MPSPLLVGLQDYLKRLRDDLLDLTLDYDKLESKHLTRSVGFRVLASAAVEEYVEARCLDIAAKGVSRFLSGQPTRTGPALVVWYQARKDRGPIPLVHVPDATTLEQAAKAYEASIRATHGMSDKDLRSLVWPLGLEAKHVDDLLLDALGSWSTSRDRAVHIRLKKVRTETTPQGEWKTVSDLLPLLTDLDDNLEEAVAAAVS